MAICPLLRIPCDGSWIDERRREELVLKSLLDNFPEFRSFYQNERKKIKSNIYWVECDKISGGLKGYTATLPSRDFAILLKTIPAPIDSSNAYNVAYELGHCVRIFERKAFAIPTPPDGRMDASYINTMIEDPLVDSILLNYGFDLKSEYETQLEAEIPSILSITTLPNETVTKILYVKKKLCCGLLGDDFKPWSEFETVFGSKFPHLMVDIDKIYTFIKRNNFRQNESVEKVKKLLEVVYGVELT